MARRLAAAILLALAAGGLAACGGGGGEKRLTEKEFVSQGNAICLATGNRISEAAGALFRDGQPGDEAVLAFAKDKAIPEIAGKLKALASLKPPENLQKRFEAGLVKTRTVLEEVIKEPSKLATDGTLFDEADKELAGVGLTVCAE